MGLVLDCPERTLRIRVRDTLIAESCAWEGISIARETQGQYRVIGHGTNQRVGSGTMKLDKVQALVVSAVLTLHQRHLAASTTEVLPVTEPLPVPDTSPALDMQMPPEVLHLDNIEQTLFAELGRLPEQISIPAESPAPPKPIRRRNTIHPKQLPLWSST